jgi:capsular polysaccharide biosynthesis protein
MYGDLPFGLFSLPEATLRGDASYIFTREGAPLREQNADFLRKGRFLKPLIDPEPHLSPNPRHVRELLSLTSRRDNCFWHWMMDSLPKVTLAESCGYTGHYLLPPESRASWARESVVMLGIDESRIVTKDERDLVVEHLSVPTYFCGYNAHHNLSFLRAYREALRATISTRTGGPERLIIGRPESAAARRVLNQDELAVRLSEYGFHLVYFERLSLSEQIRLARSAQVILGPHSSGLTHQLVMDEGARVIELFPFERKVTNDCYEQLAGALGHRYHAVVSEVDQQTDILIAPAAIAPFI